MGMTQIRQYQVSANPDIADTTPSNIKILVSFDQPQTNHKGGWIGFSPRAGDDHNLYMTDIGSGNVYKISSMLVGAVSRKIHGATAYDIDLPLTGNPGIECRSGGANGNYAMVFKFAVALSTIGNATVTGTGVVDNRAIDTTNGRQYM
jgi:hypothetical protein